MRIALSNGLTQLAFLFTLLPLSTLACRSAVVDEPPKAATVANGDAAPPAQSAQQHDATPLAIGAPCPTAEAAPAQRPGAAPAVSPCGKSARVSVVTDPSTISLARTAPCKLTPVSKTPGTNILSACVSEGKLYVQNSCVVCRMVDAGWSAIALIGEMTREQALAYQQSLGLPVNEPLFTEQAWMKALGNAGA